VSRNVGKRYRALAVGEPSGNVFEITDPIGPVPHSLLGSIHGASVKGKPARSSVVVLEQREGEFLCDVHIETGRPHQIRIHLAAAGHPLVGDPLYPAGGVPERGCRALPGDPGYSLHAAELTFRHPRTGRNTKITCQPPPSLRGSSLFF
jgi:23S rRNA pseudouridine1911/1915/1917 synthase